jgi:hypothetical protein
MILSQEQKDQLRIKATNPAWLGMISNQVIAAKVTSKNPVAFKVTVEEIVHSNLELERIVKELTQ